MFRLPLAAALALGTIASAAWAETTKLVYQSASPGPSMSLISLVVADKAGFFDENGVALEIRFGQGGPMAAQVMATGNADMSHMTFEPFAKGYEAGLRGRYLLASWDILIYYIGVPEESAVQSAADLKGATIGVPGMGSAALIIARNILADAGLGEGDYTFVPVGLGAAAATALSRDQIAAYAAFHGAFGGIVRSGQKLRYFRDPVAADVGNGGYFFTQKAIDEKPEAIAGFIKSIIEAEYFLSIAPEKAVRMYWEAYPATRSGTGEDEAMSNALAELAFQQDSVRPPPVEGEAYGRFDPAGIETYIQVLVDQGYIAQPIPVDEIIDDRFIDKANEIDFDAIRKLAGSS